ncbi:hypothetical protein GNP82_16605 [Aliivibrio fischeri]|uniref:EscU/YscU/HrcU family type III secretion system export apparatus switch protein n=1 Tax=Aliivibrio fischeri TaxID=668 RepID=UPI0012D93E21|nr:EscU/YscU/HrcU family type III secretion system export apparatus switch protein [Aliivibrio fischeri]MUK39174.1 hypothetical protein [Aliivibrio fischeri]MUL04126.1 hypothetical protein [Aliivibrio fischeri]MUL06648.1 hypothetical protein [Aliivibrio fischeri]
MEKTEDATPKKKKKSRSEGQKISVNFGLQNIVAACLICFLCYAFFLFIDSFKIESLSITNPNFYENLMFLIKFILVLLFLGLFINIVTDALLNRGVVLNFKIFRMPNPIENMKYLSFKKIFPWMSVFFVTIFFSIYVIYIYTFLVKGNSKEYLFLIILGFIIISLVSLFFDYFIQRAIFEKNNRMSKHDIKKEHEDQEGKAIVKSHIQGVQNSLLSYDEIQELKEADAIILNPIHIVVAIKYDIEKSPIPYISFIAKELKAEYARKIIFDNRYLYHINIKFAQGVKRLKAGENLPSKYYSDFVEYYHNK